MTETADRQIPYGARTVTLSHGAVHVLLPYDCPCGPTITLGQDGKDNERIHPAIGEDEGLVEPLR